MLFSRSMWQGVEIRQHEDLCYHVQVTQKSFYCKRQDSGYMELAIRGLKAMLVLHSGKYKLGLC